MLVSWFGISANVYKILGCSCRRTQGAEDTCELIAVAGMNDFSKRHGAAALPCLAG